MSRGRSMGVILYELRQTRPKRSLKSHAQGGQSAHQKSSLRTRAERTFSAARKVDARLPGKGMARGRSMAVILHEPRQTRPDHSHKKYAQGAQSAHHQSTLRTRSERLFSAARKVDTRLLAEGNSTFYGTKPVHGSNTV